MAEKLSKKAGLGERGVLLYRNLNVVGAVALFGFGLAVPPLAPVANVLAAIDVAQAGGAEFVRRASKKRNRK